MTSPHGELRVFAGNAGESFCKGICEYLDAKMGDAFVGYHKDGEERVKIRDNVRDCDVFIVNSIVPPATHLIHTQHMLNAAHYRSASRVTAVIPYMGFNRQDRKDESGVAYASHLAAQTLVLGRPDRFLLLDLHQEATEVSFLPAIPDKLYATKLAAEYLNERMEEDCVIASIDESGAKRARFYAERMGFKRIAVFGKTREEAGKIDDKKTFSIGDYEGKDVCFVDDMTDTGGSFISDAEYAVRHGAKDIYGFSTHALFSENAVEKIEESPVKKLYVTNSVPFHPERAAAQSSKIEILDISHYIAEAIHRIHCGNNASLSEMYA